MSIPYPGWSAVYGEVLTATKISQLGANDDALVAGGAISKSTDANGWTKYAFGTHTVYRKRVTFSVTKNLGEYSQIANPALPVGMSTIGSNFVNASFICGFADDTQHGLKFSSTSQTTLPYSFQARVSGPTTFAGWVDYTIVTP